MLENFQHNHDLDVLYGELRPPQANAAAGIPAIKAWEIDNGGIKAPKSLVDVSASGLPELNRQWTYIWLIGKEGQLMMAVEECVDGSPRIRASTLPALGHPTLVNGDPARLGGELTWDGDAWSLNAKSGRYSAGRDRQIIAAIMGNCQQLFKNHGLTVRVS
jgi:hypothetical protein